MKADELGDEFLDDRLPGALQVRDRRAGMVMELDDAVSQIVAQLKERGIDGASVRGFVIAHTNPLAGDRSRKKADFDGTISKMLAAARELDVDAIEPEEMGRLGGGFSGPSPSSPLR